MDKINITQEEFGVLCACALRYCHGRKTYMPSLVRDIVKQHISELADRDIRVMVDDCNFQRGANLYGDERIDKPGWLEWEDFLKAEAKRRGLDV